MSFIDARGLPDDSRIKADLIVIGGGMAGIAIAHEWAGAGLKVAVLESGDRDPDPITAMVTELLAREPDATVLSEADLRWDHLSLGVYERQCVAIHGVLGRTVRTITIPSGAGEGHHH